jgi:hypothetical protein
VLQMQTSCRCHARTYRLLFAASAR